MHVLGKIIGIMEMYDTLFVSFHDMFRQKETFCDILADLACHVVSLYAVDRRILVGILLNDFLVVTFQKA